MAKGRLRLFFRILYRTLYFLLYILLLGLLIITPADAIERSVKNRQRYNIWILTIGYAVTIFIVCFIYAMRLYVNKTALASIPKAWVPIEKADVKTAVYKMITVGLNRSAAIAFESRPRVEEDDSGREVRRRDKAEHDQQTGSSFWKRKTAAEELGVALPPHRAVWGEIEHPGWASPNSADLPNLQYSTVISELPNLIEAKALTLAPPDPTSRTLQPMLDPEAVGLLQRPPTMGLREYINHLASLGVLEMDDTVVDFLALYEYARFSTRPLSNDRFRELMHLFADLLRDMAPLDLDALDQLDGQHSIAPSESDIDNDAPRGATPSTPQSNLSRPTTASTESSVRRPGRNSSANTWYRTAPNTPGSRRNEVGRLTRQSSGNSFAQTRRAYPISQPSSSSLRSGLSDASGSVIRLAMAQDDGELPYVLSLRDTAGS